MHLSDFLNRASKLRNELENEEFLKAKEGRIWPDFRAGDAIAIDRLPYATATQVETFKGVVLAKTNKKNMSQVLMCNVRRPLSLSLSRAFDPRPRLPPLTGGGGYPDPASHLHLRPAGQGHPHHPEVVHPQGTQACAQEQDLLSLG